MGEIIFIDHTKAEKVASGLLPEQCLIIGCSKSGRLVCEEHQKELGPEALRLAKLKVLAYKYNTDRNVSFKNFNRVVDKARELKCDEDRILADLKKNWPSVSEEMVRDIVNCLQ